MSTLSAKARDVSHSARQALARSVAENGDVVEVSDLFSLLQSYTEGEITLSELKSSVADYLNQQIDVPVIGEDTEQRMFRALLHGTEMLLFDLAESGKLPTIAEELINGNLRVDELDDRLAELIAERVDFLPSEQLEEMVFDQLLRIARSLVIQLVRPQ